MSRKSDEDTNSSKYKCLNAAASRLKIEREKLFWLIPGSGVMKTDAAATKKGAASK